LLGDVGGKTVLDFGCGSGDNVMPLLKRGATVIGIDISPELIEIAKARVAAAGMRADLRVGSAYETGLPTGSVDTVFCMSLVHHLDIPTVREEMRRVLAPGGQIVFKEPIRFSRTYSRVRSWLPTFGDVSEHEHPLTRDEFASLTEGFSVQGVRYFRLPFVSLALLLKIKPRLSWQASNWCLRTISALEPLATVAVGRMVDSRPAFQTEYQDEPALVAACA
jgi:SAM-dependent methyltransferase